MRFRGVLLFLVILLFIPIAFSVNQVAKTDYNESGNSDNLYQLGLGRFNSQLDPDTVNNEQTTTVAVTTGRKVPLVSDLDGDGFPEVVILDGRNIEIFQNKTLTFVDSFTLDTASDERFSNMITFDIDGDGVREIIIVAEEERELHILQYNRSNLINQTPFAGIDLSSLNLQGGASSGEVVIKCSSTERCLMVYPNTLRSGFSGSPVTIDLSASFFNSSQEGINPVFQVQIDQTGGTSAFCQSNIRHLTSIDYDADNGGVSADPSEFEFIGSVMEVLAGASGEENVVIFWLDILPNSSVVLDQSIITNERPEDILGVSSSGVAFTCDNSGGGNINTVTGNPVFAGFYVTSPLVFDAESTSGLETLVGMAIESDDFKIIMFEKDGSFLDDFPEATNTEGIMMSNIFKADIFDDSTQDFCIVGFNGDPLGGIDDSLSVTCGSRNDPNGFGAFNIQTLQFRFDKEGLFNISLTYDQHAVLAHSAEMNTANDVDEIVSAYGVLELNRDDSIGSTCSGLFGSCDMDLVFPQRKTANNPRVITTDAFDEFGLEDMLILTDLNLFLLDDGVTNQPVNAWCGQSGSITGTCSIYKINPCLDSTWKQNTSVQILVTPKDPEFDLLSVRARLYAGDTNQFDSGFINISSGQEFEISQGVFTANKSGGGFQIIIDAIDINENPTVTESVTKTFSVASSGVETFDCTSTFETGLGDVDVTNLSLTPDGFIDENAPEADGVKIAVNTLSGIFGLGGATVWLIIMAIVAVGIITGTGAISIQTLGRLDFNAVMAGVVGALFVDGIIFIIGAINGVFSAGVVFLVILLFLIVIVAIGTRFILSSQNSAGM